MEHDHVTQFAKALRAAGLVLKGAPVFDDRIHRVDVEGKPGGRDGSYRAKIEGNRAFGWFQNWTIHTESIPWHANGSERLTREQRRHLADERAAHDAARVNAMHEQHEHAAADCQALWDGAQPVETHLYLTRKGVPSYGLRIGSPGQQIIGTKEDPTRIVDLAGVLFIPMRDGHSKLWSLQFIRDGGSRWYHLGGRKEGCHMFIPGEGDGVCFVEGYATGASVHELSGGLSVIVAFDSGNLSVVAKAYAGEPKIIAADNDHQRERELDAKGNPKPNTGKAAALAAAEACGGVAVLPEFAPEEANLTDWNDLVQARGIDEASMQFRRALQLAKWDKSSTRQRGI